jgi:hypothetical protein
LTKDQIDILNNLADVIDQACCRDGVIDSCALGAYADAMRLLAENGIIVITHDKGRRVIGYWADKEKNW